jgi:predicted permease
MEQIDRIWKLVARKVAGEASKDELAELDEMLKNNSQLQFQLGIFYKLWHAVPKSSAVKPNAGRLIEKMKRTDYNAEHAAISQQWHSRQPLKRNLMFRNYLKSSWRNLLRNKSFSLVNITGLSVGMASAILILVWIGQQLSYDMFHEKKDRIYEVYNLMDMDGKKQAWSGTSSLLGPAIQLNYPQAEEVFRVNEVSNLIFTNGDKHLEAQGYFTDPGFLRSLDFPLVHGNIDKALERPESVVLTEKFAKRIFDDENPVGKAIKIDSNANFMVTGIIKDPPSNTSFVFDYLIPMSYRKSINWEVPSWDNFGVQTFVMLKPGVTAEMANKLFRNIVKSHAPEMKNEIFLHPMSKWWLYSGFENGKAITGRIRGIRMFGIIGAFILLIACINYMNLSTAKSEKRAREVGIRKVIGARKGSLVWQFICESLLITFIAGIIALIIAEFSIGAFNKLVYADLTMPYHNPWFWLYGSLFIVTTGLIAGSYPALYLAAHRPIRVLKGIFKSANTMMAPRKVLVVFQFSFAIVFIICTIVIYRQIKMGQDRDAGFDKSNLVYIYLRGNLNKDYAALKNELYASGAIESVTRTNSPISQIWTSDASFEWEGKDPAMKTSIATYHSDNDFAKTMGIQIAAGRDLNALDHVTDTMGVLLNESAVRLMGLKNPVGEYISNSQGNWQVVGVIKDFNAVSPYSQVIPIIVEGPKNWFGTISFRLNKNKATADNLTKIESVVKKYNPDYPSDFVFVDEDYERKFSGELHTGKLAGLFAGLAIFISCLGLYALASYMAANRIKEIGVRKVLGASISSITTLLSKDFVKLVIIAFVIASPVAWWMMHSWLNNYTYRVTISPWVFIITGLISLFIAIVTISFQAIKAAIANPVKSLRTE